jgi:beta-lactamase regulating signal transducer with metallopeptidase domain
MSVWADGLLRNSVQGGVAILLVLALFRAFPRIPGSIQVWMWRAVALKFVLGMILPVTIFTETWKASGITPNDPLPAIIVLCSALGLGLAGIAIARDWFHIRKLANGGEPIELAIVDELRDRLHLHQRPIVLLRGDLERPMLSGVWRPIIHLPANLDRQSLEMVLAHELAHIKRRDLAWEWLFVAVEAFFFFHPLVWLMRREHRMSQENACDAVALQAARTSLSNYGRMLLDLTVVSKRRELAMTANMAGTYAALHARILKLHRGHARIGALTGLALIATGLALLPTWRSEFRVLVPESFRPPQPRVSVAMPYVRFGSAPATARTKTPKEGRP